MASGVVVASLVSDGKFSVVTSMHGRGVRDVDCHRSNLPHGGDFRAGMLLLAGLSLGLTVMLWQLCRQLRRRPGIASPA